MARPTIETKLLLAQPTESCQTSSWMSHQPDNISAGTQVVALVEIRGPNKSLVHPRGAVGVVARTPAGDDPKATGEMNSVPQLSTTNHRLAQRQRSDYGLPGRRAKTARQDCGSGEPPPRQSAQATSTAKLRLRAFMKRLKTFCIGQPLSHPLNHY
jgi:hypothetical protein